ncbi:hypothetical protein LVO79_05170 [Roseivivax marinus]|uniref:hypothetical protein n=1 Tax=Roseivivax marinus TaxID=1379903 RepID=UPI001F0438FC|nr:hypothetical protein [Roseivivax marinus]UMA65857.1 hypothetical protein LVO79_05170 [Roseivivax marinus]
MRTLLSPRHKADPVVLIAAFGAVLCLSELIFGWAGGADGIVRVKTTHPALAPSSAVCLTLICVAILLSRLASWRPVAVTLLATTAVLSVEAMIQHAAGDPMLIDTLFVDRMRDYDGMSAVTAGALILLAGCNVLLMHGPRRLVKPLETIGFLGVSAGCAIMLAHSFDQWSVYSIAVFRQMSELETVTLAALFGALALRARMPHGSF